MLGCVVSCASSFSRLLKRGGEVESCVGLWAVTEEVDLAGSGTAANTARHLKNILKPELYWNRVVGCQVSKHIGAFCLPEDMADINH